MRMSRFAGAILGAIIGVIAAIAIGWNIGGPDKGLISPRPVESRVFWATNSWAQFGIPAAAIGAVIGFLLAGKED